MKKILRTSLVFFGILVLLTVVWIAQVLYLFTGVHPYVPDPVYSADRSRVIIPSINFNKEGYDAYLQVHIEVQDTKSGKTLFQVQTNASDRMRWSVGWVPSTTRPCISASACSVWLPHSMS